MTRYISDQNKVVVLSESGTYANWMSGAGNSRWPGEVTDLSIDEAENKIEDRFLGNLSRSFGNFQDGPIDVTGTLTLNAQDMYFIAHAIGSVAEAVTAGENVINVTEVNSDVQQNPFLASTSSTTAPFSFRLQDSKQAVGTGKNFTRSVRGVVLNGVTLNMAQGEKVTAEVDWIGESIEHSSGLTTTQAAVTSRRPYLWSDVTVTLGGLGANSGSVFDTAKDISFEVANNIEPPHYLNGSRVIGAPFAQNRDYTLTVTSDLDSNLAKIYYDQFFRGGSVFHSELDLNADTTAGSQHTTFFLSGCEILSMDIPSTIEGTNEVTMEIRPKNVNVTIWDDATAIGSYNPF